jgi:hypothetical protein
MIKEAMTRRLRQMSAIGVGIEVVDYSERTQYSGGCETCYFEWQEITYILSNGKTYTESITFGELIYELDN